LEGGGKGRPLLLQRGTSGDGRLRPGHGAIAFIEVARHRHAIRLVVRHCRWQQVQPMWYLKKVTGGLW
jgi:hypothetical protein